MRLITGKAEASIAVDVLVEAYANAPNISWMFTQSNSNLQYFFHVLINDAIDKKGAYLTSNDYGVLVFHNMETKHFSVSSILRKAYLVFFIMGLQKSIQLIRLNRLKRRYRPKEGCYGSLFAIRNNQFRRETGYEFKKEFPDIFKNLNQPIYAETTNERTCRLYQRLGFIRFHEIKHPYADLTIYFLKKDTP
jgi:hypothetical protein